jgi:hypothetical protein
MLGLVATPPIITAVAILIWAEGDGYGGHDQ